MTTHRMTLSRRPGIISRFNPDTDEDRLAGSPRAANTQTSSRRNRKPRSRYVINTSLISYITSRCLLLLFRTLGPYLVIISFSSTARILLKLPHGKPLFTLRMLRRTRDTKLLQFLLMNTTMRYISPGELLFSLSKLLQCQLQSCSIDFIKAGFQLTVEKQLVITKSRISW